MTTIIIFIHIIVCIVLILAVLLQSGKAADLAGAFGGAGTQSVFGPRGAASLLSRVTTACAILFMVTSLGLWLIGEKGSRSVVRGEEAPVTETTTAPEKKAETKAAAEGTQQQPAEKKQKSPAEKK